MTPPPQVAVLSLLGSLLVAGCGGEEAEDPVTVLAEAFAGDHALESGVLDLRATLGITSTELKGREIISLSGPFAEGGNALPAFDLDLEVVEESEKRAFVFDGGVTAAAGAGYLAADGDSFRINEAVYDRLRAVDLAALDPGDWVVEPSNVGSEEIEGTEVIHISGSADVLAIAADLSEVARQAGLETEGLDFSAEDLTSLTGTAIDVYVGAEDRMLRQLDVELGWEGELEGGTPFESTMSAVASFSQVNEEQLIEAPDSALPLSAFADHAPTELSGLVEFLSGR